MIDSSDSHPGLTGSRSVLVGAFVNLTLAVVKGVAGIVGSSSALLADAVESVVDVVGSLIVWGGLRIAARPPDDNHPYGHGKAEPLAAASVGVALALAAAAIVDHSIQLLHTDHEPPRSFTILILIAVIFVKEILFRRVIHVGKTIESTAVVGEAWHHRADALTSVAALIGVSIAVWGGPAYSSADEIAALFAAAIIAFNAYQIVRPALSELSDAVPKNDVHDQVRAVASSVPGVRGLDKSFVRKMGFDYYADIHVIVDAHITVREGHDIAHRVKDAIRERDPRVKEVLVHVEPEEDEG